MNEFKYIYWNNGDMWCGYLAKYPDRWTQGCDEDDLREHLIDLHRELTGDEMTSPAHGVFGMDREVHTFRNDVYLPL